MSVLLIKGPARLSGHVAVPPDKSICHRALILAAFGRGTTRVAPISTGADNLATARALSKLGVAIDLDEAGGHATIEGVEAPSRLVAPSAPIDCENSGTTMRLLTGVLSAAPFTTTLVGDESLSRRPMTRLMRLEKMGAKIEGTDHGGRLLPPLKITGGALTASDHQLGVASAQVKSAVLLAGLFADGTTTVKEPGRSRDHTERMLRRLGVAVDEADDGTLSVTKRETPWRVPEIEVPPDFSSAAFLLAAAAITRSDDVVVRTGINPTRTGFLDVLEAMGAEIEVVPLPDVGGEPQALLKPRPTGDPLAGTTIEKLFTLRAIDEIPLLAGLAAFARGRTVIRDAQELRVKESDRLKSTAALLRAFGAQVEETYDGLEIEGGGPLHAAEVDPMGDHRIALTAAVMALGVSGTTEIHGSEVIDVSFPGFTALLASLGVDAR